MVELISSLIESFYLLGIIQGCILFGFLWFSQKNQLANRFMAAWIILFSLELLFTVSILMDLKLGWYVTFDPIYGCLFLFYTRTLCSGQKLSLTDLLHLIPIILVYGISYWFGWYVGSLLALSYGFYVIYILRNHQQNIQTIYSDIKRSNLRWLLVMAYLHLLMWLFVVLVLTTAHLFSTPYNLMLPTASYCFFTLWLFILAYIGVSRPKILCIEFDEKYGRSIIKPDIERKMTEHIQQVMVKDRLFLTSQLTLKQLSDHLGFSTHEVSQVINRQFDKNFYELINQYRVDYARKQLEGCEKIIVVAIESGFNSLSSFNRVFKQLTGFTPSEYRKSLTQKGQCAFNGPK